MNDDFNAGGGPAGAAAAQAAATIAHLTNMSLAARTLIDLQDAGLNSPRIGLFYGPSGYGKSMASAFCGQSFDAAYVEAKSLWSKLNLLEAIAAELGIAKPARTAPRILAQIVDTLNGDPRPLIIDEMDHLVRKGSVEIIRDIHDATRVPILLIGEETLPHKLQEWERFHNRILVMTPAQPAGIEDGLKLRDLYCNRVEVSDDLVAHFTKRCHGVTRRIVVNLQAAQREAMQAGERAIDTAWWGARPVNTGDAPIRRKAA